MGFANNAMKRAQSALEYGFRTQVPVVRVQVTGEKDEVLIDGRSRARTVYQQQHDRTASIC